jgi:hypothetical protein
MTKSFNYGTVTLTIDPGTQQQQLPNTMDGYNNTVAVAPFDFGTATLSAGLHTFTFTVNGTDAASTGDRYEMGIDTLTLVPAASLAPFAVLSMTPGSGSAPLAVTADASGSVGGSTAISAYTFDFGDGTVVGPQSAPTTQHTYTTAGTYLVNLTVTDRAGNTARASRTITVLSSPPVVNSDFETGTLDGWNASYNAGITTTNPHTGTYAGQLNATTGNNASVEQVVTGLTPNTSYTLTGWVRTDGGTTYLGAKLYDTTGNVADAATTSTGWTQLTDHFTTGAGGTSVDIYCYRDTAGTSACDDITLVLTPAPGATANPDFETGNLAGWNASYNAGVTTANPHSGTYAGQINATPAEGNGAIEQVVTGLIPNTSYTLTGWVRTDGSQTILGAKQYDAANDNTDAVTTSTGWTQLTDVFTTGPTSSTADIYCYRDTAGTSACDDITLTRTPATVANPDFEAGSLAGWTTSHDSDVTTTNPHSGSYTGEIDPTPADGDGAIEQVVTGLTPNTGYTLTGWVRTDGGTTYLGAKLYDTTGNVADAATTSTGWTQLTDHFTTGAGGTSVDIYCYRDTMGTSDCDDISLTAG